MSLERHEEFLKSSPKLLREVIERVNNKNFRRDYPAAAKFYVERILGKTWNG